MTSLFVESMVFEKKASTPMEEDPSLWGRQVLIELFRQVPEAAEYSPEFMMYKVDEEQGYALGSVILKSTVDSALKSMEKRPSPVAIVPVIIENYKMKPLDVMYGANGKALPLTADRVRQALFRPDMFSVMASEGDLGSLYNVFYPPGRSDNSFGSGYGQPLGGSTGEMNTIYGPGMQGKYAMLEAVAPTVLAPDLQKLSEALESHPYYLTAMQTNSAFLGAISGLAEYQKMAQQVDPDDMMYQASRFSPTTITQIGYDDATDLYWVKSASANAYTDAPKVYLDRKHFLKMAGPEATKRVDTEGTLTLTHDPQVQEPQEVSTTEVRWEAVGSPGVYKVKTPEGTELTGWVLPGLVDISGIEVPLAVFSNGSNFSVQNQIMGARVADSQHLPVSTPKGTGIFFVTTTSGIRGTVPVTIVGSEAAMDGSDAYHVTTYSGQAATIRLVEGLRNFVGTGAELSIPAHAGFMSLNGTETGLASSGDQLQKTSSYITGVSALWLGDGSVRLAYRNLPKLASVAPSVMPVADAFWYLGLAGLSAKTAADLMAKSASTQMAETLHGCKDIQLLNEVAADRFAKVAQHSKQIFGIRQELTKEASVLPSASTVDAVLSLQFINSENVRMYISRIPYLEQCLNTLCELLIAQRLGVQQLPEGAISRAIRGLDSAIGALRGMAMSPDTLDA